MYIASWEEFSQRAKALFQAAPDRARYCIRYNHSGSKLVIKVTDDSKVLQFRTDQERDIKRVDELTGFFLAAMSSSDPAQHEAEGKSGAEAAAAGGQRRAKRRN